MCKAASGGWAGDSSGSHLWVEYLAQFLQGAAHLRLDRPYGTAVQFGDLLVGQFTVLPEKEYLLFLGPQVHQGVAQLLQRFLLLERLGRRGREKKEVFLLGQIGEFT